MNKRKGKKKRRNKRNITIQSAKYSLRKQVTNNYET